MTVTLSTELRPVPKTIPIPPVPKVPAKILLPETKISLKSAELRLTNPIPIPVALVALIVLFTTDKPLKSALLQITYIP
ncbi:hypothetical protein MBCUT_09670 [Methanobrevibacter cuticularis]|uniref:Uncharacterized protein n=1 Tax=Methanobrevibacter cuticularis TaxID=47311 RepID=A0A166E384_9EURY|nr:hypothetical protein MBCUT_09670 [Methanobrevibacter cuticularis]